MIYCVITLLVFNGAWGILELVNSLKRFSTRRDVANAVVFLARDYAELITAQLIMVDGGLTFANPRQVVREILALREKGEL